MGRPRTRTDDEILDATVALLGREGPAALTLAAVGRSVGLSPATLVQRFGGKRGLIRAMAERAAATAGAAVDPALPAGDDPPAALAAALGTRGLARALAAPAARVHHLAVLQLDLADPELHVLAAAHARGVRTGLAAVLARWRDAGSLRPDADPEALARAVWVALNGALVAATIDTAESPDALLEDAVRRLLLPHVP
ncbi:MAG TPA: helix-turn-helix domain-containing protein [Miltoncostaeaceae bacterium]|nr:helix-turn-helix domain-containing protein [Miltoncostaeaceae bacterium]